MDTVYVLGAGASAAAAKDNKRVLGDDFLRLAFEKDQSDPRLESLKQFVFEFFHYDASVQHILPTVEEVLSVLDIALERGEAISAKYTSDQLQELRRHVALLIYFVLEEAYLSLGNRVTNRFVDKLGPSPTVVSFNYDLIVDSALSRRFTPGGDDVVDLDYGIEYRTYLPGLPSPDFVKPNAARLYKIHGSLNWAVCPTCGVVYIGPPNLGKSIRYTFDLNNPARCCEPDHAPLEPLLITPTYLKSYARPQVSLIWQRAERALRDADQVVFVGYSLPDADFHIKYLLQKAFYRSREPKIVVVDYKPAYQPNQPTPEEVRYKRLFGTGITYYTGGFVNYVDDEMEAKP